MRKSMHISMDEKMQECIDECQRCHNICTETISHCLEMGGDHADPAHIRLLMDCADICQTSVNFMLRKSELHDIVCGVCAGICEGCADECESFSDDNVMQQCAEACRSCADSCNAMVDQM